MRGLRGVLFYIYIKKKSREGHYTPPESKHSEPLGTAL